MQYTVVTTFHDEGMKRYGQRMIDTYCSTWPKEVKLYVYAEKCVPRIPDHEQVILKDLDSVQELTNFKNLWKNVPKANGDVSNDPVRSKRKDAGKGFKWNAIRFAHKVYAIFDCAKLAETDFLIWMDADSVCHSSIDVDEISKLIPSESDLCFLGREGKYSECGLYALNLKSPSVQNFLREFQRMYDDAEHGIFTLAEWHDSFVFDAVRTKFRNNLKEINWSLQLGDLRPRLGNSKGEGHPLINSQWGAYLDHLKGDRKDLGRSKREDLKINRTEAYWR